MINRTLTIVLFFVSSVAALSQPPYADEIRDFAKQDSASRPPKNAILFVGSSSFRLWKNVQHDFSKHVIINRGFGGSTLEDVFYYKDKIIFPYQPKQVVIYCGENDVAGGASAEEVFKRFTKLFESVRNQLPKAAIAFVSMKASPSRAQFRSEVEKGNALIRDFLKRQKRAAFIDVFTPMLNSTGQPRADLFLEDNLHMNEKGYAIWREAIEPFLN